MKLVTVKSAIISLLAVIGGCHTTGTTRPTTAKVRQADIAQAAQTQVPIHCSSGNPAYFTIGGWDSETPVPDNLDPPVPGRPAQANQEQFRLDFCIDEEGDNPVILKQVLYKQSSVSGITAAILNFSTDSNTPTAVSFDPTTGIRTIDVPAHLAITEGLEAALFDGDYQDLLIQVPISITEERYSLVETKGHRSSDGWLATAARLVGPDRERVGRTSLYIRIGTLEFGDPFPPGHCRSFENEVEKTFYLGRIRMDAGYCTGLGGGFTASWRFFEMKVTDPQLEAGQGEITLEGDALSAAVNSRYNHHNGCDSFYLKTPYAEYAVTTADNAGCGEGVEHAPIPEGGRRMERVTYRVRYDGGEWRQGEIDCKHFLFDRRQPCPVPE